MSHDKHHDALNKATKTLAAVAVAGTLAVGADLVKDPASPAFGITAEASQLGSGTTTVNLNLRKGAGTGNAVIKVLPKGTKVEILSSKNGWLEVKALGSKGWVSAPYVNQTTASATKQMAHTVAKGDTLSSLSRKYGITVAQLQQWNNLKGTTIKVGQKLIVSETAAPAQATTHTVAKGDTLYSVSRKYGVTVAQLQQWNNLKGTAIKVGQRLIVSGTATTTHTVVKGDTLSSLSRKYGVTVAELQQWNKLSGATIKIGQKLIVSGGTATAPASSAPTALQDHSEAEAFLKEVRAHLLALPEGVSNPTAWSPEFLDRIDLRKLYHGYSEHGMPALDLEAFSKFVNENAPIVAGWEDLIIAHVQKETGHTITRFEAVEGSDAHYRAFAVIDGKEVFYITVNARTGYYHG